MLIKIITLTLCLIISTSCFAGNIVLDADDRVEYHQKEQKLIAKGNATASKENLLIKADSLTGYYDKTGKNKISRIEADNNVTIKTNTGKITLDRVIASEKMSIHTNTGKINLNESDAGEIFIKTNTGNVDGTLLTDKAFVIRCNTGKINIPDTFGNSKCEIISNTGHINFKIKKN